ncbi:hypothetical protein H012_gp211 [Acanthamoeba polyphaga moumouvirus]|uniref:Uncharacterized protein n=1 Tax=Acanthamoeba polyphaga moumouvirus TaxID=1269028 RepID=L7RD85_9VIRU|nr:hypothetical protein H012_gp211 [Acanthamoeba polyphaga moumouvirus]AGC02241.1 hypothetical protein Moumou_00720 [Acanthamoeba polyphaga moumouvirus]
MSSPLTPRTLADYLNNKSDFDTCIFSDIIDSPRSSGSSGSSKKSKSSRLSLSGSPRSPRSPRSPISFKLPSFLKNEGSNENSPRSPRSPKTPNSPKKICGSVVKFIRQLSGDKLNEKMYKFDIQRDVKPFFAKNILEMSSDSEDKIYPEGHRVDICIAGEIIGFAIRKIDIKYTKDPYSKTKLGFWEGYVHVPDFKTPEENRAFFDYMFFQAQDIPDIKTNSSTLSAIGWDHDITLTNDGEVVHYVNLAETITEIWSVWKCVRDYHMRNYKSDE